ncbi:hypothetical protein [Aliikangiella sp. G2MR2-5]|uniref:hypothetical protein n=1 Tax=Aliikangiella sp. G2MR2-5 TaxID=2788943 RepID=UPI0018A99580|nr:hypothetical protein [Aliikangiella sp. G2MR2-5]
MKITINVIEDLLPLYFDEELSSDSREIIEDYFKQNPDYEKKVREEQGRLAKLPSISSGDIQPEDNFEKEKLMNLKNTQHLIQLRTIIFAVANFGIFFPLVYYTFYDFGDREFKNFSDILTDVGGILFIVGVIAWIAYFVLKHRLRTSEV